MTTAAKILAQHPLFVPTPLWMWAEHASAAIPTPASAPETVFSTAELLPVVSFVPRAASLVERAVTAARAQVGENPAARQVAALCWSENWPEAGR